MYIHNGRSKVICLSWLQLRLLKQERIMRQEEEERDVL